MRKHSFTNPSRAGFSLVEVSLALGIVSFSLIGLMGLFLAAFNGEKSASDQASAMELISAVTSDINSTKASATASKYYSVQFPTVGTASPVTNTFWVGENFEPATGSVPQRYAVTYVVTAPKTSYGSYQFFLRVFSAAKAQTAAASLTQTSFTESVISKSAQ